MAMPLQESYQIGLGLDQAECPSPSEPTHIAAYNQAVRDRPQAKRRGYRVSIDETQGHWPA